jgi:hypothetical protein
MFLFEWVLCAFSNIFPLTVSARLWDSWFLYGEVYIVKVCLALCMCLLEKASDTEFDSLFLKIKAVGTEVTEDALFAKIETIKLTDEKYRQVYEQTLNSTDLLKLTS